MSETVSTEVTLEEKTVKADKSSENKSPDKKQKGKIVDVVQKGYKLHDKVIRHSKVVVGE